MSPTEADLRARSRPGFWLGMVVGFAFVVIGLPLLSGGQEWPLAGMTIIVVVVMVILASVAAAQGQQGWRRVGIVGFVVGFPIGYVVSSILVLFFILGSVGS